MPKRKFVDITQTTLPTEDLDVKIRSKRSEYESERIAINFGFEESKIDLESQLCSTQNKRRKQIIEQKLEYEETLRNDRLNKLDNEISTFEKHVSETYEQRQKIQNIDIIMQEFWHISEKKFETIDWQSIRKARYIRYKLEPMLLLMTDNQKDKYDLLLKELTNKGFRIAKYIPHTEE
jgi:hypothetical protein